MIHIGYGDSDVYAINYYKNGISGGITSRHSRTNNPNGFDITDFTSSSVFRITNAQGSAISAHWYWYNLTVPAAGEDASYDTSGYNASRDYILIAHSEGVSGSMTVVNALDGGTIPLAVDVRSAVSSADNKRYLTAGAGKYLSGVTFMGSQFTTATYFTNMLSTGITPEEGGYFERDRTPTRNYATESSSTNGFSPTRDYILIQHGTGDAPVTIKATANTGMTFDVTMGSLSYTNQTSISKAVTSGTSVVFTNIHFATGYGYPVLLEYNANYGDNYDWNETWDDGSRLPRTISDTHGYRQFRFTPTQHTIPIDPFNWTSNDAANIVAGNNISFITADTWNNSLKVKIEECETRQGKSHSYIPTVYQGDDLLASDFNSVRNALALLGGTSGYVPNAVSKGNIITADEMAGNQSIKNALNKAIEYTNQ